MKCVCIKRLEYWDPERGVIKARLTNGMSAYGVGSTYDKARADLERSVRQQDPEEGD